MVEDKFRDDNISKMMDGFYNRAAHTKDDGSVS